jgi:hypothetical protein
MDTLLSHTASTSQFLQFQELELLHLQATNSLSLGAGLVFG